MFPASFLEYDHDDLRWTERLDRLEASRIVMKMA
jgi:hypothetical protein